MLCWPCLCSHCYELHSNSWWRFVWEPQLFMVSIFHLRLQIFFLSQRRFSSVHFSVLFQWAGAQCPPTSMLSSTMELFWGQSVCSVSPLCRDPAPAEPAAAWAVMEERSQQLFSPASVFLSKEQHPSCWGDNSHHNLQPTSEGCTLTCLLLLLSGEILASTSLGLLLKGKMWVKFVSYKSSTLCESEVWSFQFCLFSCSGL